MKFLNLFCLTLLLSFPSFAQDREADPEPTRLEVDSERHEIRFFIDSELAAVLKTDGLHVRENIEYGGALTDYGGKGFDIFAAPPADEGENAAE